MNILELENDLKDLSDDQLRGAMQTGSAPQYLVLSEMQRRKQMRDKFTSQQQAQGPQPTIAEEMMGGISQMAPQMSFADGGIVGFAKGGTAKKAEARYKKGEDDATYKNHWTGRDEEPPRKPDVRNPRKYDVGGFIAEHEDFRPEAYWDSGQWSIGYGTPSKEGEKITEEEARRRMEEKIAEAEENVNKLVEVDLKPNQRDSLVSLLYNIGPTQFANSKARARLNEGDYEGFMREAFDPRIGFVKGEEGGDPLPGLVDRRQREKEMFLASADVPRETNEGGITALAVSPPPKEKPGEQPQDYANEPVPQSQQAPKVTAAQGLESLQRSREVEQGDSWFDYIKSILMSQTGAEGLPPGIGRVAMAEGGEVDRDKYMRHPRDRKVDGFMLPNGNGVRTKVKSEYGEETGRKVYDGEGKKKDVKKDEKVKAADGMYIPPEYRRKVVDGVTLYETPTGWKTKDDIYMEERNKDRDERAGDLSGWSEGFRLPSSSNPMGPISPWEPEMPRSPNAFGAPPQQEQPQQGGAPSLMDSLGGLYQGAVDWTFETAIPSIMGARDKAEQYTEDTILPYWDEVFNFSGTKGDGIEEGEFVPPTPVVGVDITGGSQQMPPTMSSNVTVPQSPKLPGEPEAVDEQGRIKDDYIKWLREEAKKGPTGQEKLAEFLMHTGIGMMASNDPSTLRNLGIGGIQGLKAVGEMKSGEAERQKELMAQENLYRRTQATTGSQTDRALRDAINASQMLAKVKGDWEEANRMRLYNLSPQERQAAWEAAISPGGELAEFGAVMRAAQQNAAARGYDFSPIQQQRPASPNVSVERIGG